jgi:hypothetical protein
MNKLVIYRECISSNKYYIFNRKMIRGHKKTVYKRNTCRHTQKGSLSLGMLKKMCVRKMTCYISSIKVTKTNRITISNADTHTYILRKVV